MRRVADTLGVTPMALYAHVPSKEVLLDGLVEVLLDELPVAGPGAPWPMRLETLVVGGMAMARRHPSTVGLLFTRSPHTSGAVRVREEVFQLLRQAGVSDRDVPRTERLISTMALGYAASVALGRFESSLQALDVGPLDATRFPAHEALSSSILEDAWDQREAFDAAVVLIQHARRKGFT